MENMGNQNAQQNVQNTQAATPAANSQPVAGNQQGAVTVSAEDIAAALDARHQRTERSVIEEDVFFAAERIPEFADKRRLSTAGVGSQNGKQLLVGNVGQPAENIGDVL